MLTGDAIVAYESDWTGRWLGSARAVVRPRDAEDTAALIRLARHHGVALIARGGGTGLVGGAVPSKDASDVMVCTSRMRQLDIDPDGSALLGDDPGAFPPGRFVLA